MVATFGALLRARAIALGLADTHGNADAGLVSQYLARQQIDRATPRAVRSWFDGERAPRIGRMELVLDALGVHGDERLLAYQLASRVAADAHDTPPADAVSTP